MSVRNHTSSLVHWLNLGCINHQSASSGLGHSDREILEGNLGPTSVCQTDLMTTILANLSEFCQHRRLF